MSHTETYDLNDPESWQELHRPDAGEEISAASYRLLLERVLEDRGWIRNSEFIAIVEEIFGPIFGTEDLRPLEGRPKWHNTVDWAKATMASAGLIMTRRRQRNGVKETYIVSTDHSELVRWVWEKPKKIRFTKKCQRCGEMRPLAEKCCFGCGHEFAEQNKRVHRLPR